MELGSSAAARIMQTLENNVAKMMEYLAEECIRQKRQDFWPTVPILWNQKRPVVFFFAWDKILRSFIVRGN